MAIKISSWLKGRSDQPANAYITDEDNSTGLVDSMDLDLTDADEEVYMEKYWRLRKAVDEDEICNNLRAENSSLRHDNKELEAKLVELENAKISVEVQLMKCEKGLKNVKTHNNTERGANNARNETLKLENKMLRKNEEYVKFLLLSHGFQTTALISPPTPPMSTPELTDGSDMDDTDELDDLPTVCPEWYNRGNCSQSGDNGANECRRGAHPRLVNFSTPSRP